MKITAQNWAQLPEASADEMSLPKASNVFYAKTTLAEKVTRVFNATIFAIGSFAALSYMPIIGSSVTSLAAKGIVIVAGAAPLSPALVLGAKVIMAAALILTIRKVAAIAIGRLVYPATTMGTFDYERRNLANVGDGFESKRITLNKSGIDYDAFTLSKPKNGNNWVLIAGGNCWVGEQALDETTRQYFDDLNYNILYVNGPGVGRSTGHPTSYAIGAGQEAALQFLEDAAGAEKILMYGPSLGGGAQGEAILSHKFKLDKVKYTVWSDRTFDALSNTVGDIVTNAIGRLGKIVKPIFYITGLDLRSLEGAKKLQTLGIKHIVTQNNKDSFSLNVLPLEGDLDETGTDGVIPNSSSLYVGLRRNGLNDADRLKCMGSSEMDHNGFDAIDDENLKKLVRA